MLWLWVVLTAAGFAAGFGIAWIRLKRRLQARMNEAVMAEVKRRIEEKVLEELRHGDARAGKRNGSEKWDE